MYYIWANIASAANYYWNQEAQNWTADPKKATLWNTFEEAEVEAVYANDYGPGAAVVREVEGLVLPRATSNRSSANS
jgi:hypothetical protein